MAFLLKFEMELLYPNSFSNQTLHSLLTRLAISFPPKFDAEPALRADQHVWFRISLQCWFVVSPTDHANAHGEILTW